MFKKNIWIYWEQGWDNAPDICKLCKKSWEKLNPNWVINVLNKNNINNFVDVYEIRENFWDIEPIQVRADLIRTLLLKKYGGVWVDATLICMKPLDKWLFKYFSKKNKEDFFCFKFKKVISLSNWFLVSHGS
jgi:mannosyltransferase OCH1-like enzyme